MCGIVAFTGIAPDLDLLGTLAALAERRGPDGSGWAAWTVDGGWEVVRDASRSLTAVPYPANLATARTIIGHSRLATDGGIDATSRVQPYLDADGGTVVAYNGRLPGLWPQGDTLELHRAVQDFGCPGGLAHFLGRASALDADRQALLASDGPNLWAAQRHGYYGRMPLHVMDRPEGLYLCSRRFYDSVALMVDAPTRLVSARATVAHTT